MPAGTGFRNPVACNVLSYADNRIDPGMLGKAPQLRAGRVLVLQRLGRLVELEYCAVAPHCVDSEGGGSNQH
jgi:hypothetical protein